MSSVTVSRRGLISATMITAALVGLFVVVDRRSARADAGYAVPQAQPVIGLPVGDLTLIGSSPGEAPGETWGYGGGFQIVRYTAGIGWQVQPPPLTAEGKPLSGFRPAPGPLGGRTTQYGGVAILGEDATKADRLLVRNPGGRFEEAPAPGALLRPGEMLAEGVLLAAVEEPEDRTGAYVVPYESGSAPQDEVLAYDGSKWAREPICAGSQAQGASTCSPPAAGFRVLGIDASSAGNAWLLARGGNPSEGVLLFGREVFKGQARWTQRPLGGSLGALFSQGQLSFEVPGAHESIGVKVTALGNGQPLTVTSQGAWIDGQLTLSSQAQPVSFTLYYDFAEGKVSASWCSAPAALAALPAWQQAPLCSKPLESSLPGGPYRSFAWSEGGPEGGPYGQRVITGLDDGVTLSLHGDSFTRVLGLGGVSGAERGAAFSSPQEGWLAPSSVEPLTHLTTHPESDRLQPWPVPFRKPLTAVATQPGATPGDLDAQAIAVGEDGQVAHYYPGQGWVPEALAPLGSSGAAHPELRGVAWPESERAYAVGTHGAMWLWMKATGLWQPDPARPPNLFLGDFTGIAFNPTNPNVGYAVGQQGLLLAYGKSWEQQQLPAGLEGPEGANFTSIAFAGNEALATYQIPKYRDGKTERGYTGGVLRNDGSGWQIDEEADAALGTEVPVQVAGLPDGGAAIASAQGQVIERQGPGAPWQPSPAGSAEGFPVALAAIREGGALRVLASVDTTRYGGLSADETIDEALAQPPPEGQAAVSTAPYRLPVSGYLMRETANGWHDEEHGDYPTPNPGQSLPHGETGFDWPDLPDAVLAFAVDPAGEGWAVGGQTGEINAERGKREENGQAIQTAGVMRYPAGVGSAPQGFSDAPEQTGPGNATFAIGGDAQCATACADLAEDKLGPDQWLSNAVKQASQVHDIRGFIYTGPRLAPGLAASSFSQNAFQREENRYANLLTSAAGEMPVFAAPSETDLDQTGTLTSFDTAFQALSPPQGAAAPAVGVRPVSPASASAGYFSFDSQGVSGGRVRVVVLDYSHPTLGTTQQCWLSQQLAQAKNVQTPAIVVGDRAIGTQGENPAGDASTVASTLVTGSAPPGCNLAGLPQGSASAYFSNLPQENRAYQIVAGGSSIPGYGSGTLGYLEFSVANTNESLHSSGFLLAEVETARRNKQTNRAPVNVKLMPDISDLALDATNGVLLRRSHPALFTALARRPHAGLVCVIEGPSCQYRPNPYVPIPGVCQGTGCQTAILPQYTFTSSKPGVGDFVEPDPASIENTTVLQGANGKPIPDPHSGLFCAYNPGTTTVTIHTGGLAYSQQVTVLGGSVEQPCGTKPQENPPAPAQQAGLPAPLPTPTPTPVTTPNGTVPPPPPAPPPLAKAPVPPSHRAAAKPSYTLPLQPPALFTPIAIVPPPAPTIARPAPPTGTAQVPSQAPISQQVTAAEREEENQGATELVVHHMAAYHHPEGPALPPWTPALILIAAAAGATITRTSSRSRTRRPQYAKAWQRRP